VCPVYNNVGGHAYGWAYSGPIGAILDPQLLGGEVAGDLPFASSLCGACVEVCPVKIPIVEILLQLRHRVVEGDAVEPASAPAALSAGADLGGMVLGSPWIYAVGTQLLRFFQKPFQNGAWLPSLPPPLSRWTMSRPMAAFDATTREWWRERTPEGRKRNLEIKVAYGALGAAAGLAILWLLFGRRRK